MFKGSQGVPSVIYPKLSSSPGLILGRLPAQASPVRHYMIRDKIRHLQGQASGPRVGGHVIREGECPPQGLLHFLSLWSSSPIRKENSSKTAPHPLAGSRWWLLGKCFQAGDEQSHKGKQPPQAGQETQELCDPYPWYRIHLLGKVDPSALHCPALVLGLLIGPWLCGRPHKRFQVHDGAIYSCVSVLRASSNGGCLHQVGIKIRDLWGALSQSLCFQVSHLNWSERTVLIWALFIHVSFLLLVILKISGFL